MRYGIDGIRLSLAVAALCVLASPAPARDVEGNSVTVSWTPSSGPVGLYFVWLDYNGVGFPGTPDFVVSSDDRRATVEGEIGDTVRVRVAAGSWSQPGTSAFSPVSETFRFVPASTSATGASVLVNGSFEEGGDPGSHQPLTAGEWLPGWQVVGGSIDWIGSFWSAADGRRSLDLAGREAGGVRQTFSTGPGTFYSVAFSLRANSNCGATAQRVRVSVGGEVRDYTVESSGGASPSWVRPSPLLFQATGSSATLKIEDTGMNGPSRCGAALDDVSVRPLSSDTRAAEPVRSLVFNGSFESGYATADAFQPIVGGGSLPGWEVVGDSIDWIGSYWSAPHGEHSLDLAGRGPGGVRQTISTIPGQLYSTEFSMGANPHCDASRHGIKVSAASRTAYYYVLPEPDETTPQWTRASPFRFRASGWTTIVRFDDAAPSGSSACGPTLDDVSVRAVD